MSASGKRGTGPRAIWSDLVPRLISAAVLIALTITAVLLGGVWFALLVGGTFAGAYREWEMMVTAKPMTVLGYALMAAIVVAGIVFSLFGMIASLPVMILAAGAALLTPSPARLWRAGGLFYICLVVLAVMAMRGTQPIGIAGAFFLGVAVWLTDSAAFFVGRQVGGPKLMPEISPSKTWSGAIGGLIAGVIGAVVVWVIVTDSPILIGAVIALALSLSGQAGDLAESAIKRRFRIKDSSDLIPGHGGLLDRLDSLSSAAIVMFLIGAARAGTDAVSEGVLLW